MGSFGKFGNKSKAAASTGATKGKGKVTEPEEDEGDDAEETASPKKGFGKAASASKGKTAPAKGKSKKTSRFKDAKASKPRTPLLDVPGEAIVRFVGAEQTYNDGNSNETIHAKLEIVDISGKAMEEAYEEGQEVAVLHVISGKGGRFAVGRYKALAMALTGLEDEDAYDEADPEGELMDALIGEDNSMAEMAEGLKGRFMRAVVTRGKAIVDEDGSPTGEHYANIAWHSVDEDDQEVKAGWL